MLDCPVLACLTMFFLQLSFLLQIQFSQALSPGGLMRPSEQGFDSRINLNPGSALTTTHLLHFSELQFPHL